MIIARFILLIIFGYGLRYSRTIRETFSKTVENITNPRAFINILWGFIKGIIAGIFWKYLFITLPLAVISFFVYKFKKQSDFKNTCKKIIEDIKNDLRRNALDENGRKLFEKKKLFQDILKNIKLIIILSLINILKN